MATITVGPTGNFTNLAAAIAAANPGDTIQLQANYTEAGTVTVTKDNLSFNGDTTNTGIHLAMGAGITTVSLLGTAPFRVDDNTGANTINGNAGDNIFQVGGTTGSRATDSVSGGAGHDRLIIDYSTTTEPLNGDLASSGSLGSGFSGSISIPSVVALVFDTGIEDFTVKTGSADDTIQTGDGNDIINSGGGNDIINSRGGVDQIDGGAGNADRWTADMSAAVAGENISINLNNASSSFTVGGVTGSVAGIEALGAPGLGLPFTTGAGNDTIVTRTDLNLEDDITAGAGNDTITVGGTTGARATDRVDGGTGRDRLIVDYSTTTETLNGDFASGGSLATGYSGDISIPSVFQLVAETGIEEFTIKTGSGNDTVQTGDGNDVISTGGGDDIINSRGGVDQIDGGTGTNRWTANMSAAVAGENISINLNDASSSFTVGGVTGSVAGIEALGAPGLGLPFTTGAGNDTIVTRTDLNLEDDITAGAGNDTITIGGTTGARAIDRVDGGTGRDRLIVDYSTTTETLNGDFASGGSLATGYSGDISIPSVFQLVAETGIEDFTIKTGSGNDTIQTGDGNDVIAAGGGDDTINSRGGVDQIDGGLGNDRWSADMSAAVAGENISINLNNASSSFTVGGVTGSVAGIEALGAPGLGFTFTTGAGDDTIVTRTDLNFEDRIATGTGNDTVTVGGTTGATATDHVDGGAGRDRLIIDYHTTSDKIANNLAANGSLAAGYSGDLSRPFVAQIVVSSGFEDFTVSTGSGNDDITTGDGDDIINLGTGNDVAHAAGGTDRLIIDYHTANTSIVMGAPTGSLAAGYTGVIGDGTANFTTNFDGIENFTIAGGTNNDTITTADGADVITGGAGLDTIHAADGADTLVVGAGDTTAGETYDGGAGTDTLQVTGTVDFTGTTLTSIENLQFATSAASTATFTPDQLGATNLSAALAVTGGANADHVDIVIPAGGGPVDLSGWTFNAWTPGIDTVTVDGSAGTVSETIIGSSQNDTLIGGSQNDSITGGGADDSIDGGAGVDTIYYTGAFSEYTAAPVAGAIQITDTVNGRDGVDTVRNVEFVHFSDGTFVLNTPPAVSVAASVSVTEQTPAILSGAATASDTQLDARNGGLGDYAGASVTIARDVGANPDDILGFNTTGASFTVSGNQLQVGGLAFATFTSSGGTLAIQFTSSAATATTSLVDDVLQHISYTNQSDDPPASINLNWHIDDGETGDFGGAEHSDTLQVVNITAVNDAPVNTVPGAQTVAEDSELIVSGLAVLDADAGNATMGVTLSVLHGTLTVNIGISGGLQANQISGGGTNTVTLTGSQAQINATLADINSVHYDPGLNFNGADTLTVTTSDNGHSGTGGTLTDVDTVQIRVTPVNDAPVTQSVTVSTTEDNTYVFQSSDFSFSDTADNPSPNTFVDVIIKTLPATGTLMYDADGAGGNAPVAVTAGQAISAADIAAGHLSFVPVANGNGLPYTTFQFQVQDDGSSFRGQSVYAGDNQPVSISAVDINHDGSLDLVYVSDQGSQGKIAVRLGDGAGHFQGEFTTAVGFIPSAVVAANFNGDNNPDLVVANYVSGTVQVLIGNGNGTFQAPVTVASVASVALVTGDFDHDGHTDIAVVNRDGEQVDILLGDGTGTGFAQAVSYNDGANGSVTTGVALADVNGDGNKDLIFANENDFFSNPNTGSITLMLGNADGTFQAAQSIATGLGPTLKVKTGDFNNDGHVDLVYTNVGTPGSFTVQLGNGDGTFQAASTIATATPAADVVVADVDGDGKMDLVVANYQAAGALSVLRGNGDGTFQGAVDVPAGGYPNSIAAADFNGDGKIDLAATNVGSGAVSVILNGTSNTSAAATATVNITAVNDAPLLIVPGARTVAEDSPLAITGLSVSDVDAGGAGISVNLAVGHGTITILSNVVGGVAAGGITGNNSSSVTLTGSQTAIDATLAAVNGVVYHNTPDYNGADTLTVTANDAGNVGSGGALTDIKTVGITVTAVADIVADSLTTNEDSAITANLITGTNGASADSFEGSPSLTAVTQGTHGAVTFLANGSVTYTPVADYNGSDSFTYTVTSPAGVTETASVTVTVNAAADIVANSLTTSEDTAITANLITGTNGASADNFEGTPSLTAVTQGSHGSVTFLANGSVTYTPVADYNGSDSFTYTVTSPAGVTETAAVTVTVNAVADIVADSLSTNEDTAITANLITGTNGASADSFEGTPTLTAVTQGAHGSVTFQSNGNVTYTPVADYYGSDSFTYTVTSGGVAETAAVTVTVNPVADIVADLLTTNEDTAITANLITGTNGASADSFEGAPVLTAVTQGAHGSVTFLADGSVTYTPVADYNGSDTFNYTVTSGGVTETAAVTVTVDAVNDAPVNTVPAGPLTTVGNTNLVISGLAVSDVDATALTTTLHVDHGTLTVATGNAAVSGNGTGTLTLSGTVAQINATLAAANHVVYHGAVEFAGADSLTVTTDDGGGTGSGGPKTDVDVVSITDTVGGPHAAHDFNNDGMSDVVWRHIDGTVAIWDVVNNQVASSTILSQPPNDWKIAGVGDFNGDGQSDVLWHHDGGTVAIWDVVNNQVASSTILSQTATSWTIAGTGDFNGDGQSDVLWRHTDGTVAVWDVANNQVASSTVLGQPSNAWTVAATGDFNGDGTTDVLWRHTDGTVAVWDIVNNQVASSTILGQPLNDWQIAGVGDFDGDHQSDVLWRHDGGTVAVWEIVNNQVASSTILGQPPTDWKIEGVGDFNGDGQSDVLWRHDGGTVAVWDIVNNQVASSTILSQPATDWHIIV